MAEPARTDLPAALLPAMVAALEEDIVFGRLHPRERLIEEELTARFGATRHSVRQALAELERMGLIERIPNRGALVKAYSLAEVEQLYALRILLETRAAQQIPLPLAPAALAALRQVQARHDAAVEAGDPRAAFRANIAFHHALFAGCGNVFLAGVIEDLALRAHGIRFASLTEPRRLAQARAEHHAMLAALESGDRAALVRLCGEHLLPSKEAYLRAQGPFLA
ncbi:GntR family transcriptional regulator [Roseomonas sp. M0104]|uniref:GntR family transcriptional regulator n=1 Tax=Teichococcus coralli TaxID=2545983 RepID=A0A845BKT8_9PROT|nr:GntR family transcriptional regulator [Pseudoroseomonas coralli]MXP65772.1 GntR family transcriptional regulator [Pseudoroseomonas coralli]